MNLKRRLFRHKEEIKIHKWILRNIISSCRDKIRNIISHYKSRPFDRPVCHNVLLVYDCLSRIMGNEEPPGERQTYSYAVGKLSVMIDSRGANTQPNKWQQKGLRTGNQANSKEKNPNQMVEIEKRRPRVETPLAFLCHWTEQYSSGFSRTLLKYS